MLSWKNGMYEGGYVPCWEVLELAFWENFWDGTM